MKEDNNWDRKIVKMFIQRTLLALCILLITTPHCSAENILMNAILGKGSHFYLSASIGEQLVKRGHNVTFLIGEAYEDQVRSSRFGDLFSFEVFKHPIPATEIRAMFDELNKNFKLNVFSGEKPPFFKLLEARQNDCVSLLDDEALLTRLNASNYSAIVYDMMWICGAIVGEALDIPHFGVVAFPNPSFQTAVKGSDFNAAFIPTMMTPYSNTMTFLQRTWNTLMSWAVIIMGMQMVLKPYTSLSRRFDVSDPNDLMKRSKLFLVNSDFAGEYPCALPPNVIPVGGLTVQDPTPLPYDLEDFVQGSGNSGIIVCAFGSFLTLDDNTIHILKTFSDVFSRLPQRVILQMKGVPPFPLPPNVKTLPWLPLNDLLGHPSTRAFLYHGGHNSFYEALFHDVPTVVIPIYGDQIDTSWRTLHLGLGLRLDKTTTTEELFQALQEVMTNRTYKDNVKRRSAIFRDRPMRPAERASFWVQHAITHGADYMDMPIMELNYFQYYLWDVYIFLLFIVLTLIISVYAMCACTCRRLCGFVSKHKEKNE